MDTLARTLRDQLIVDALDQLAEAVTVHDLQGRILYANHAALALLGFASSEELLAAEPGSIVGRYRIFHPDGRPVDAGELPGRRVLEGEEAEPLLVRWFALPEDEPRWSLIKARALRDGEGAVLGAVNVMEDVTQVQQAEFSQRLLAEASERLASSMDLSVTLRHVADLAVPALADWCGVDVLDQRGAISQVAVAHSDPELVRLGEELRRRYPVAAGAETGLARVIRTGELELVADIHDEMLVAAARDTEHLALLRELNLWSVLMVPLQAGERIIGALSLALSSNARRFTVADIELARELGRRAGVAVENARLFTERGRIAELLQASLLPPRLPTTPGWTTATRFRPAGDLNRVGGDFYDAQATEEGLLVCVGDVAGKGPAAAALTGRVRHALTTAFVLKGDLPAALAHVNHRLLDPGPQRGLCTLGAAALTPDGEALIALAGHPPPLLIAGGEAEYVGEGGIVLGAIPDADWPVTRIALAPGDLLVLYTDGVTDAVGAHGRFGAGRLLAAARGATTPAEVVEAIDAALRRYEVGPQSDDIAVLAVQRD